MSGFKTNQATLDSYFTASSSLVGKTLASDYHNQVPVVIPSDDDYGPTSYSDDSLAMARKKKQNPALSAPPLQKAPEDDTQPTRRITRSMESKTESANTSTSALSSAGVASGAGAPSNHSTATPPPQRSNKLPPHLFVIKNTTYNLPIDPVLLDSAVENEPWEARVSRFKSTIDRVNPNANTPVRSLAALFNRYLKVSAWAGQSGRSQKLIEAREAFERVRKSGALNQIMNSSKPAKTQGPKEHSAAELSKDDWVYPEQPTLLAPESEGESLQDRLKRLCTAILVANAAGKDEMTPTTLETVMSRWISKHAFRFTPDGKTLRQNVLQEVDELRRSVAYREVIDKSLADFSASEPASATHESNAGIGPHRDLEETDGECDKPPGPPNDKLNLGKEDAESALDNSALVSGRNEATGHSKDADVTKPGPAPTASEWASLLETGPEVGAVKSDAEADMALEQGGEPADAVQQGHPTRIVMSEQQALEEQRSYYPATSTSSSVCVVCGSSGHVFSACPGTICKHCMGDHFAWACPQRGRCAKCKQFGHKAAACPEKLAMVMEEGLECAFCSSHTHLERDCDVVWRSFHPRPEDIRTVRQINAACAICGSVSHFSSDCGLFGDRRFNATWSLANRNQYVDESSEQHAIAALSEVPEPAKFGRKSRAYQLNELTCSTPIATGQKKESSSAARCSQRPGLDRFGWPRTSSLTLSPPTTKRNPRFLPAHLLRARHRGREDIPAYQGEEVRTACLLVRLLQARHPLDSPTPGCEWRPLLASVGMDRDSRAMIVRGRTALETARLLGSDRVTGVAGSRIKKRAGRRRR